MFFFNLKTKKRNYGDSLSFGEVKKFGKKNDSNFVIPMINKKTKYGFYKIGEDVYAPVPQSNEKKPLFFKVDNITFVSQSDTEKKSENRYNIAIEYKKNGSKYFYSYSTCDEFIKSNICEKLKNTVNINVRNKESVLRKPVAKRLEPQQQENMRRNFFVNSPKHIDTTHFYTQQELVENLKKLAQRENKKRLLKENILKRKQQPKLDPKKLYRQEEIDDILFFE